MMRKHESVDRSIDPIESSTPLRDYVRCALPVRRARMHAVLTAAGLASVSSIALGQTFPPVFPLANLYPAGGGDGSAGFVLTGAGAEDYAGRAVSAAGDVNGDGIGDVIIGAVGEGAHGGAGESYVVFGSTQGFPAVMPLGSLYPGGGDGSRGFVLTGTDVDDASGRSVSAAGDVNGDGIEDLIIGARLADPYGKTSAGESYVVFGSTQGFPAVFPLGSLFPDGGGDGSRGFVLTGVDYSDFSGTSVSAAGDVNGDGIDDLIVGAVGADGGPIGNRNMGECYVVFGSTEGFPAVTPLASLYPSGGGDGSRGFVLTGYGGGSYGGDYTGNSVSGAGDVNGDGFDDVIVGAKLAYANGEDYAGKVFVVFGSPHRFPPVFPLAKLHPSGGGDGTHGFVLTGGERLDEAGYAVSAAGDVNGDGVDDVVVGIFSGLASYVVFGSADGFPPLMPLASLYPPGGGDGSRGFVVSGAGGWAVSDAGDVNRDGVDDLIVTNPFGYPGRNARAGASYVVFGSMQPFSAVFQLRELYPPAGDGSHGFVLNGIDEDDFSGRSVSAAGDVNGDGIDDVIVGAPYADPGGHSSAGESYVVFGRAAP